MDLYDIIYALPEKIPYFSHLKCVKNGCKIGISTFINKPPPQKLVLAPGAIVRGNTVY